MVEVSMDAPRRIAVWNTAFLGDAVLTLPLIRTLRAAWPDAALDFYVRGGLAPLFAASPKSTRCTPTTSGEAPGGRAASGC